MKPINFLPRLAASIPGSATIARMLLSMFVLSLTVHAAPLPPVIVPDEAPRVRALLEQAWSVEFGQDGIRHPALAITLYCMAGRLGSAEAYFRAGLLVRRSARDAASAARAATLFANAARLGHAAAVEELDENSVIQIEDVACGGRDAWRHFAGFKLDRHIEALPGARQRHAHLLRSLSRQYGIPPRLALAVALVESNFHAQALSPKEAMGIMQLIPETAARFAVLDPYDPEQNMRGGLAYLRWLKRRFDGDLVLMVAAYNAGEGAVERYGGVPPYAETRDYVLRVLGYAMHDPSLDLPPSAIGPDH